MIYKIRIILDAKEQIFRDIEIKEKQTLWNLHLGIKSAFSLQGEELSSFYYSDDNWSEGDPIPLEDLSDDGDGETMSDVYLSEAFPNIGSKMHFKYGLIDLWEFFCELLEITEEKSAVNYPITVFRFGNAPLKAPSKNYDTNKKHPNDIINNDFDSQDNDIDDIGYNFDEEYENNDDFTDIYYDDEDDYK